MSKKRKISLARTIMLLLICGIYFFGTTCSGSTTTNKKQKENKPIETTKKTTDKLGNTHNSNPIIAIENKPNIVKKTIGKKTKILATEPVVNGVKSNTANNGIKKVNATNTKRKSKQTTNNKKKTPSKKQTTALNNRCCYIRKPSCVPTKQNVIDKPDLSNAIKLSNIRKSVYAPYIQVGSSHSFSKMNLNAAKVDLFVPIWQRPDRMIFTDLRGYFPFIGANYEGNFHLGYRQIIPNSQILLGAYVGYDRKKPKGGGYFNQVTFGVETWLKNWFIGANFYKPFGKTTLYKENSNKSVIEKTNLYAKYWIQDEKEYTKAMTGFDFEVGKEITPRLTGYVGGYYFFADQVKAIYGPRIKATYDLSIDNGDRVLGIFDKVSFGAGLQHDKVRGTSFILSINARIGLSKQKPLSGVTRHMLDTIRRDTDIVYNKHHISEKPYTIYEVKKTLNVGTPHTLHKTGETLNVGTPHTITILIPKTLHSKIPLPLNLYDDFDESMKIQDDLDNKESLE